MPRQKHGSRDGTSRVADTSAPPAWLPDAERGPSDRPHLRLRPQPYPASPLHRRHGLLGRRARLPRQPRPLGPVRVSAVALEVDAPIRLVALATPGASRDRSGHLIDIATTADAPRPWRPFSARYGIMGDQRATEHSEGRHRHDPREDCEADRRFQCRCPGHDPGASTRRCCAHATQEDRLCDECRGGCVGTTGDGTLVILADLWQAT